jgi:voltage-gated potassium channel
MSKRLVRRTLLSFIKRLLRLFSNPIFIVLSIFGNLLIATSAISLYLLEFGKNDSITSLLDSVWWAVSTVTTVGYGDVSPITPAGRIVGIFTMIVGTALFWSYTALFAEALVTQDISDIETELRSVSRRLKQFGLDETTDTDDLKRAIATLQAQLASSEKMRTP